ncbi:propanediol dehydratase small subunit [Carnobacterium alterfunditum]|uniref:Propanediol dehydratase small subunit n=1 Tax=Carnobacterium alterfunditum TaxID=28230 RepID=A0A1N6F1H4_9LACT|nr:diol dehydratase small subunit [Carnobacterium alterfunditum]SIN89093.1 propanediol dehydratase small subunit [Carnobacterium alterfunditum]
MSELDDVAKKIVEEISVESVPKPHKTEDYENMQKMGVTDYPLYTKHPDLVKSPTGKLLDEITLTNVMSGVITSQDLRITPDTLRRQGEISESSGRAALKQNFARAAELTAIPDERILQIYETLRPYRSTKEELVAIAEELEVKYNAPINGKFIREAAKYYEVRKKLKGDN